MAKPDRVSTRHGGTAVGALLRFYVRGAVRLAWLAGIPVFAAPTAAVALSHDPNEAFHELASGALGTSPSDGGAVSVLLVAMSLALAFWAVPRLSYGATAWMRHLPASDRDQRRGLLAGLIAAQMPVAWLVGSLWLLSSMSPEPIPVDGTRVLALLPLFVGAAHLALPCRRRPPMIVAGATGTAAALGNSASFMALSLMVFLAADRWSGPVRASRAPRPPRVREARILSLPVSILIRAVRRRAHGVYLLPAVVLAATTLFIHNNELDPALAARATRFGGGLAQAALLLVLGRVVATMRPPWPWARSLPWSSGQRVVSDTAFLCASGLPVLVLTAAIDSGSAIVLALALPLWACRVSSSIRHPVDSFVMAELFLSLSLVALLPASAWGYATATPIALRWAARKERRSRASLFERMSSEGHGDTQSWSGG